VASSEEDPSSEEHTGDEFLIRKLTEKVYKAK
jgi:hypothetical protein